MLFQNESGHKRMRTIVGKEFMPQKTASFRPVIEEIVHELLDQLENKKMADMVSEFAFPLASLIIADMLGVPAEERYQFRQWTADLIQTIDLTRTRKVLAKAGIPLPS